MTAYFPRITALATFNSTAGNVTYAVARDSTRT
jgi:hypothetical protein